MRKIFLRFFKSKTLAISLYIFVFNLFFTFINLAHAQPQFVPQIPNPTRFNSAEDIINVASGLIVPAFIIGFGAMLFVGAATYLSAGDDQEKVKKARNTIIAAIIGFTLAVLAPTIMNFVAGILGVEGGLSILGG